MPRPRPTPATCSNRVRIGTQKRTCAAFPNSHSCILSRVARRPGPAGVGVARAQDSEGNQGEGQGGPSADSDGKGPQAGGPSDNSGGGKPVSAQEGIPEVELGRLNVVRSPDHVLDRAYAEALASFTPEMAAFYSLSLDDMILKLSTEFDDIAMLDSPLQNLALCKDALDGTSGLAAATRAPCPPRPAKRATSSQDRAIRPHRRRHFHFAARDFSVPDTHAFRSIAATALTCALALPASARGLGSQEPQGFDPDTASVTCGPHVRADLRFALNDAADGFWDPPGPADPRIFFDPDADRAGSASPAFGFDWQNGWRGGSVPLPGQGSGEPARH